MNSQPDNLNEVLDQILLKYGSSFSDKVFLEETTDEDDLMQVFGLTQALKAENKQYWGRELGKCWEKLIVDLCRRTSPDFGNPIREGKDELCDLAIGQEAIDTKYRIGSGDAGTLKKFGQYSARLQRAGYKPVLLILRTDSLPAAITNCRNNGWRVLMGDTSYKYILDKTGFDLESWLKSRKALYNPRPGH